MLNFGFVVADNNLLELLTTTGLPEISQMSWNCLEIRNCPEILL